MPALNRTAVALVITFLVKPIHAQSQSEYLVVFDAWVRESPPNAMALAGYMKIDNSDDHEHTLIGASSPAFEWIEMHRTVHTGSVVRMIPQESLPISPGGELVLQPGGNHLMLMNPTRELHAGDLVQITLTFADGMELAVPFRVEQRRQDKEH